MQPATKRLLPTLRFHPLTAGRWPDLERLFGRHGACAGCWCMWWRVSRAAFTRMGSARRRAALRRLVQHQAAPGILAYAGDVPVGWCAIAPRAAYPSLERSHVLTPIDDVPVWSIVCLFVARSVRGCGITLPLIRAAVAYARSRGARMVEAYPAATARRVGAAAAYMGTVPMYRRAGFHIVGRPSAHRRIMRDRPSRARG